jgi:hypothetical protein
MRLGQLARRLSVRPAQIVEFLASNSIQIENNSNTRLEDAHVSMIVEHYAPGILQTIANEPDEVEESPSAKVEETPSQIVIVESIQAESIESADNPMTAEEKATMEAEVIRVQKIELSGLKVLGKIELPEPKKKETSIEPAPEGTEETVLTEKPVVEKTLRQRSTNVNRKPQQNRERSQRSGKNPVELQRDREAREAEAKRQRDLEREKEKRKKHYQQKMKSVNTQPKKLKVKTQSEGSKKPIDNRPVPKTWIGKFLRWWTT